MIISGPAAFIEFYNSLDLVLMIFARFAGFIILLPVFSGQNVPTQAKIFFAMFLAILVGSSGNVQIPEYSDNTFGYLSIILSEFITGFIISFVIYLFMSVFLLVGQLTDYQIGFSMVSVFDPISQIQVPITGNLYYLVMTVLFIQSGSIDYFIYQIFASFQIIPLGGARLVGNQSIMMYIVQAIIRFFEIGISISLPVVGTIIIIDVVLGILVKAVPQMNIFVVGMPIKVFLGLIVMWITAPLLGEIYKLVIDPIKMYTINILRGLVP